MKNLKLITLALLMGSHTALAQDPGSIGSSQCGKDPRTGSGYKCYNKNWSTVPKLKQHLQHALVLGNHDGDQASRMFNGAGVTEHHCSKDVLANNVQAANRSLWSLKCGYVDFLRVKENLYTLDRFDNPVVKPIVWYPLYGTKNSNNTFNVHRLGDSNMNYRTRACNLPANLKNIAWCEAGCFAGDQPFPYIVEDIENISTFKEAPLDHAVQVYSLSADSELDNLQLETNEAWSVKTSDDSLLGEEVYEIHVEGKAQPVLRVSGNHPLVNDAGEIVVPVDMVPGDKILSTRGSETVSAINVMEFDGDMYNVLPTTKDLKGNIIVMGDGYLVGSQRIQRKEYGNMKRAFYRQTIAVD